MSLFKMPSNKLNERPMASYEKKSTSDMRDITFVNLADCAGPSNSKCNLGECGQKHETSLGPMIPNKGLMDDIKDENRRYIALLHLKRRQILKWLEGISDIPYDIPDKLLTFKSMPPKPKQSKVAELLVSSPISISKVSLELGANSNSNDVVDVGLIYNELNCDLTPKEKYLISKFQQNNNNNITMNNNKNKKISCNWNDTKYNNFLNFDFSQPILSNIGDRFLNKYSECHVYKTYNDVNEWLLKRTWYRYDNRDDLYMLSPKTSSQSAASMQTNEKYGKRKVQTSTFLKGISSNDYMKMPLKNEESITAETLMRYRKKSTMPTATATTATATTAPTATITSQCQQNKSSDMYGIHGFFTGLFNRFPVGRGQTPMETTTSLEAAKNEE